MKYVLAVLFVSVAAGAQAQATDCTKIENARERLACYDRQFPRTDVPSPLPEIRTETIRGPDVPAPPPTGTGEADPPAPPVAAEPEAGRGGLMDWDEAVNLSTTIKSVRRRDQQKMVFRLANDQIWIQDAPRSLPIREGDEVTITNATVGGYMLRTAGGVTTRVHRIK
jgi:hypothetical protein